jgi:hypothetical protein
MATGYLPRSHRAEASTTPGGRRVSLLLCPQTLSVFLLTGSHSYLTEG